MVYLGTSISSAYETGQLGFISRNYNDVCCTGCFSRCQCWIPQFIIRDACVILARLYKPQTPGQEYCISEACPMFCGCMTRHVPFIPLKCLQPKSSELGCFTIETPNYQFHGGMSQRPHDSSTGNPVRTQAWRLVRAIYVQEMNVELRVARKIHFGSQNPSYRVLYQYLGKRADTVPRRNGALHELEL